MKHEKTALPYARNFVDLVVYQNLSRDEGRTFFELCGEIGRLLASMKNNASDFCQPSSSVLRESSEAIFLVAKPRHIPPGRIRITEY